MDPVDEASHPQAEPKLPRMLGHHSMFPVPLVCGSWGHFPGSVHVSNS